MYLFYGQKYSMDSWKKVYQQHQMQEGLKGSHWIWEQSGKMPF